MNDQVNNPKHYTSGKIEVIDFIEDQKLGFHLGNVVKYVARAGKKDPAKVLEDLKKAEWYLKRYIEMLSDRQWVATFEDIREHGMKSREARDIAGQLTDTQMADRARNRLNYYNNSNNK